MDAVERRRDVVYRRLDGAELLMDVWLPRRPETQRSAVLFVHGGPIPVDLPLSPKEWGVYLGYGALAAAAGLVGVTFNHRLHALADLDQAWGDVLAAIEHVRASADDLGFDPDRLCVWAFSGGGPLLASLLREAPPYVRGLASFYASLDLRELPAEHARGVGADLLERYSPAAHVHPGAPPCFVARAGLDSPGLNGSIDSFVRAALAANVDLTLVNHFDGHHGFDVQDDTPRTHEIVAAALEWVKRRLA